MASANYSGLANLMNLQGVGVNPTSQLAYVPSKDLMTRYQTIPNPRTGIPQAMGVTGMAEGGMPSEQYPMQEEAMELANRGRYGDTTLVHMTPGEVQGLSSLGQLTINPETGLPEAFSLKSIIPMAASIIGGMVAGPAGAAIGSGLGTMVTGGSPEQALLSSAMSFGMGYAMQGGGSIFGDLGASAAASTGLQQTAALGAENVGLAALDAGDEALGAALSKSFPSSPDVLSANNVVNLSTNTPTLGASLNVDTVGFDPSIPLASPTTSAVSKAPLGASLNVDTVGYDNVDTFGYDRSIPLASPTTSAVSKASEPYIFQYDTVSGDTYIPSDEVDTVGFDPSIPKAPASSNEGVLESIFSPNRQSLKVTPEKFNAAKLEKERILGRALSQKEQNDLFNSLQPSFLKRYGPVGAAGIGGLTLASILSEKKPITQPERTPAKFPEYELVGGERLYPTETAEEIMKRLQKGGVRPPSFSPYEYNFLGTRTAAAGGIVGLQQGGMATPQAPSAMASMLAQPQPQQSIPINVQVQPQQSVMPQQPQPSMPMSQTGSGVAPIPDQQKEFIKLMDMEEQVQSQKSSQSTQALANIMGLGMNFSSNQYPQTSPSGQAVQPPSPPPMNYGSQVNLGLAGGGQPYFEGQVQGPGDGQSDEVAFRVDGGQVDGAMLSPDEYVLAADVVSAIGNGSSDAGAEKLDQFMKGVRQDAYGTTKQMQPFNNQGLTNLVA